ncbi:hypothetical protein V6N11_006412 [Hibiscus sabdariffa]|uniref:Uncharacterized protein n=1 Tax=Hibiscus sabdariffa TaxID=183260 RepID=A0ABR2RQT7_9ROSI
MVSHIHISYPSSGDDGVRSGSIRMAGVKPISIFAVENIPNFNRCVTLFGDAKVENGSSSIRLTSPQVPSSGLLLLDNPFKFVEERNAGFRAKDHSASLVKTCFWVLDLLLKKIGKFGAFNANHVGIDVGSLESVKVSMGSQTCFWVLNLL